MARSLLFNVLFYVTTTLFVVIGSPLLFAPRRWAMAALKVHSNFELWLLRTIVGTKIEVRGEENIPQGPCLVASKHQSAWETFALIPLFRDPALLMKRELFYIPFHGWFSKKFQMIPVDRDKGPPHFAACCAKRKSASMTGGRSSSSRKERGARQARRRTIRRGSCSSTTRLAFLACRSPSIRACSGRGGA